MPRESKGIRGNWSANQMREALTAIKNGASVRKASNDYRIPRRTLRNHVKTGKTCKQMGRLPILSPEQEDELAVRIARFHEVGFPLSKKIIQAYAYEYCKKNSIPNDFNDEKQLAGKYWFQGFMKRHPNLSVRTAQILNPARAQKINPAIVSDHFEKLDALLTELDLFGKPEKIFNIDEKGCRLTLHKNQKILAPRGNKRVHIVADEHAENVTIVACGNAIGNVIPPMVIFKGKRANPSYGDDLPPGATFEMAPKGSMTHAIFVKWLKHFSAFKPNGRVLLIMDGATCHLHPDIVDEADKNDVTLYCLPSNTTHELQPFDKAVFKSFEHNWDIEFMKFRKNYPGRTLTKDTFGKIFTPAWKSSITASNIINGFRATGICPFNPDILPPEAYGPSYFTENVFDERNGEDAARLTPTSMHDNLDVDEPCCSYTECAVTTPPVSGSDSNFPMTTPSDLVQVQNEGTNFATLMKTPKREEKNRRKRRKALNFKANRVCKQLFMDANVKTGSSSESYQNEGNDFSSTNVNDGNKLRTPSKSSPIEVKNRSLENDDDQSWYCELCEEKRVIDMRTCISCKKWYHDECIGLTKFDEDIFTCPDCES